MKNALVSNVTTDDIAFIVGAKVAYMGTANKRSEAINMATNNRISVASAKVVALELKDDSIYLYLEMFMTNKGQGVTLLDPKLVRCAGRMILTGLQSSGRIIALAIG